MNKLRERRKEKGFTLEGLAEMTGVSKSYISDLEIGNSRNPSLGRARLLAMALCCDVEHIFPEEKK